MDVGVVDLVEERVEERVEDVNQGVERVEEDVKEEDKYIINIKLLYMTDLIGCEDYEDKRLCYLLKYAPLTWTNLSLVALVLSYLLKMNNKVKYYITCSVILNSVLGIVWTEFLGKEKLMNLFNLSNKSVIFYDTLIHFIPLYLILKNYSPPKTSLYENLMAIIIFSIFVHLYDNILSIKKMYLSVKLLKNSSKTVNIMFYILCYLVIISLYKRKFTL